MKNNQSLNFSCESNEKEQEFSEITFKRFCPYCGNEVIQSGKGRPRKFCSERCLRLWQNKNQCPPLRKTAVKRICPVCGKEFLTDRLNSRPKKYCSISCANKGRVANKGRTANRERKLNANNTNIENYSEEKDNETNSRIKDFAGERT